MTKCRSIVLFGAVALTVAASAPMAGQTTTFKPQRTAWGDPNITGVWQGLTGVPLERPLQFKGREFLTDEEVAVRMKARAELQARKKSGDSYEFAFRSQSNFNNIFAYEEALAPIARRTAQIIDPPDGRLPPLTMAALQRWEAREKMSHGRGEADSYIDRNLAERCIKVSNFGRIGNWGLGDAGVNLNPEVDAAPGRAKPEFRTDVDSAGFSEAESGRPTTRILQAPGYVATYQSTNSLTSNGGEEVRIIPLDGRAALPSAVRSYMGDSRGRWEGNTLVVETRNFNDPAPMMVTYGDSRYPGTRETLVVVERFTLTGPDSLDYRYTINDPETYTRPYTVLNELSRNDKFVAGPDLCHENNKDLPMQLSAARADEASALDFGAEFAAVRKALLARKKAELEASNKGK